MNKYDKAYMKRILSNLLNFLSLFVIVIMITLIVIMVGTNEVSPDCEDIDSSGDCTMYYSNDHRP